MSYIKRPAIFGVNIASLALLALSSLASQAGVSTTLTRSPASPRSIIRIEEDKPNIVLSAQAKPMGTSLTDAASITAAFNTTDHSGDPPDLPLQMLYPCGSGPHHFEVQQGTYFYVPVLVNVHPPSGRGKRSNPWRRRAMAVRRYSQGEWPRRRQVSMTLASRAK